MGRMPGPGMPGSSFQHAMQQASPQYQPPPQASFALSLPVPAPPVFRTLSTCSWEQTESVVKVYVPLRGVHTELLRAVFEPNSVEVRVIVCVCHRPYCSLHDAACPTGFRTMLLALLLLA